MYHQPRTNIVLLMSLNILASKIDQLDSMRSVVREADIADRVFKVLVYTFLYRIKLIVLLKKTRGTIHPVFKAAVTNLSESTRVTLS